MAWYDDNRVQNRNARITEMMKQDPQTVDILNMGDSLSLATLTPMEMWRQKGYTSFNIGADSRITEEILPTADGTKSSSPMISWWKKWKARALLMSRGRQGRRKRKNDL